MAATKEDVKSWVESAKRFNSTRRGKKAKRITHVISVCDTFDYTDYPVNVFSNDDLKEVKKKYDGVNMQKINEVIEVK